MPTKCNKAIIYPVIEIYISRHKHLFIGSSILLYLIMVLRCDLSRKHRTQFVLRVATENDVVRSGRVVRVATSYGLHERGVRLRVPVG
jgi:hypothetical protein